MNEKINTGFLKFVIAKGRIYVYLAKEVYIRKDRGKNISKTEILYRFGEHNKALEMLYSWRDNYEFSFPKELIHKGYGWPDLNDWILSIETGYSKMGRKLSVFKR
ncbi:hypothetical protein P9Z80_24110 [Bacillus cereus]|nr:hypothetical protein [Bacillus cereus]MEC3260696.1 hypothetical protein [Bacillus cereus]